MVGRLGKDFLTTMGGLEIERLKSINISGPESDSDLILFSVASCFLHLNLLKKLQLDRIRQQLISRTEPAAAFPSGRLVPGRVHVQEAAGGHREGRQHHQLLGRGLVHNNQLFSGLKSYQKDI